MLYERFPEERLANILLPREAYHPFPRWDERAEWEALPGEVRAALIAGGERRLEYPWPAIPALRWLDFTRDGDRSRHAAIYFEKRTALRELLAAECAEGQGRFLDAIFSGVWSLCEESSWVIPAHNGWDGKAQPLPDVTRPTIDLFAAETGAVLAWVHYLLGEQLDGITPLLTARLRHEVAGRILEPFRTRQFAWMGLEGGFVNNWNPWCTSNCLTAVLLLEEDAALRVEAVARALRILDVFLGSYGPDGGCDEGPSYWGEAGAALFDALQLLAGATGGQLDVFAEPLIQEMGRYLVRMFIDDSYFVNFADCPARLRPPGDLVYRWGTLMGDEPMRALGAHFARSAPLIYPHNPLRDLAGIFNRGSLPEPELALAYLRETWLPDLQVMTAREQARTGLGFFLAAKGGHNAESHNHNDVGSFVVYRDGRPLLLDVGVETYSAKTFSPQRYEIWTMQSAYHNLPTVNGVMQKDGREFRATGVEHLAQDERVEMSLDLATAYPPEAGVRTWRRTCRLLRGAGPTVEIVDQFTLDSPTKAVMLSLMTCCEPAQADRGALVLSCPDGPAARLSYDGEALGLEIERVSVDDRQLQAVWGDHLYRLLLRPRAPVEGAEWRLRVTPP